MNGTYKQIFEYYWQNLSQSAQKFFSFSHMQEQQSKDPLHGVTLEHMVHVLAEDYGWEKLATYINIRCFAKDPSVQSSLKFLRRTPWARKKVEKLYITTLKRARRRR